LESNNDDRDDESVTFVNINEEVSDVEYGKANIYSFVEDILFIQMVSLRLLE
jgi:hypothetical protein